MAIEDPIIGSDCYSIISADKTEIIEGESVQFTIELFGNCSENISVDIFINNILVNSQYLSNGSLLYTYTFNESGEFTVSVDAGNGSSIIGDSINITVEEATIELPTSQVSWGINNKNVQSIEINNKEVKLIITSNGEVLYKKEEEMILWAPQLNGETGAKYQYSYSEANGEAVGKGFIFNEGFDNTKLWELSFEFRHDIIRYTGICFLVDMSGTYNGVNGTGNKVSTWEGTWTGGSAYASYTSGTIDWFDVTVTKIDSTHIRLQSTTLNRDTTVEVTWLPDAEKLSFGAVHNSTSSEFGPCRIRNILVRQKVIKTADIDDDGEIEGATIETP